MRVMLIDDDEDTRVLCRFILGTLASWEIVAAVPGPWTLDRARRCRPDLILLGLERPADAGFLTLRRLRMLEPTSSIPVIVITAADTPAVLDRIRELGAQGLIPRAFSMSAFLTEVDRVLTRPARSSAPPDTWEGGEDLGDALSQQRDTP